MKKKFSLNERLNYHSERLEHWDKSKRMNSKQQYSLGFISVVDNDRPLDFDKRSQAFKNGCYAGERAKAKAFSKKF